MKLVKSTFPMTFVFALIMFVIFGGATSIKTAQAASGEVLILGPTVTGGASSLEATETIAVGKTPVVVDAATWAGMTTSDFASYDAIVLGDPTCQTGTGAIDAAIANASVWGAAVTGNVIINGTDPVFHGKNIVLNSGIAFAVAESGQTGLYCSLSCYYYNAASGTPVPLLDGISGGGFTVVGQGGCPAQSHIVATHPALSGLTDAYLSNWGCSTHEGFVTWPSDFLVLAISLDVPSSFVAADGTTGAPYMVARGKTLEVISDIKLTPKTATNNVGTSHTVTATVTENGTPTEGTTVTFTIISGPHSGLTGSDTTDSSGLATFTYTGTTVGTDTIHATFVDSKGKTQTSNEVTKTWEEKPTAVELVSFKAKRGINGSVVLTWQTATETDNAGFNIHRSSNLGGPYTRINDALISAKGRATSGASYTYSDAPGDGVFFYKLEDVDVSGKSTFHGPVDTRKKMRKPNKSR